MNPLVKDNPMHGAIPSPAPITSANDAEQFVIHLMEVMNSLLAVLDEETKLVGANVDLTYPVGSTSRVQPYVLGGIGAYHTTISVTSGGSTASSSETKVAWNLGGGILYRIRGAELFLEARYIHVAAVSDFPKTAFLPIAAGIRLGGG